MIQSKPITVLDAPSNLGLKPQPYGGEPGVRFAPDALRRAGMLAAFGAMDGGRVEPTPYAPDIDPISDVRGGPPIRDYCVGLADRIGALVDAGQFPLVLGGDCSILLGGTLALRQRGRYGLFFIDGHRDYLTPQTSESHGAAGMDLALATGHGPDLLTNISGLRPYVRPSDGICFGYREIDEGDDLSWNELAESDITCISLDDARTAGIVQSARHAIDQLDPALDGFWIHLDADVLDDAIMPAVDSRQPGGMTYVEMIALLSALLATGKAVGLEVTIYDPLLDPSGSIARAFVSALAASLTS